MGRAMRLANRDAAQREQIEQEKQFRGFSRPPLFKDISPQLMDFIGESRRNKLTFLAGAMASESFPPDGGLPEVAICGRSNVGKSSIINAVTLSTVARSSDKPGMTQQFNFYLLPRRLTLVDLPGYGFAFADPHKMEAWRLLMDAYMSSRRALKRALLVIDARHGLKANDVEFMGRLERARTPFQVVMTKCDLTREEDLARRHAHVAQELRSFSRAVGPIRLVSAYTGAGLADLAQDLLSLSVRPPPRAAGAEAEDEGGDEEYDGARGPARARGGGGAVPAPRPFPGGGRGGARPPAPGGARSAPSSRGGRSSPPSRGGRSAAPGARSPSAAADRRPARPSRGR